MSDLAGRIQNLSGRHAAARREARERKRAYFRQAMSGWNMQPGDEASDGLLIGSQHPGTSALMVVRGVFNEYNMPTEVKLEFKKLHRSAGHGQHAMSDGVITIQATLSSISGPKHYVDIPVRVRAGRILTPSILVHQGVPRVIAQNTLDSILAGGEFTQFTPTRTTMYGLPAEGAEPREVPRMSPGMFHIGSRSEAVEAFVAEHQAALRDATESALANETVDDDVDMSLVVADRVAYAMNALFEKTGFDAYAHHDTGSEVLVLTGGAEGDDKIEEVRFDVEARFEPDFVLRGDQEEEVTVLGDLKITRRAFYDPQVTGYVEPGLPGWDVPGADRTHIDVGERPTADMLGPGERVKLREDVTVRDRGGVRYTIKGGTEGSVIRDVDGANYAYYVRWDGFGPATVARAALK